MTKLSINLVHGGRYVKAGDPLPPDFELPSHLESFAIYDDEPPPQGSRADPRFSPKGFVGGERLAKSAANQKKGKIRL